MPMTGTHHMVLFPAAGLPWFVAPFGRDSLIVSLQTTVVDQRFARGTLEVLAPLQAKHQDDYRDARRARY
jgi:glycogen debranching enzyme